MRRSRFLWLGVGLASSTLWVGDDRQAWANGAFPDSLGILVPSGRPKETTLSTNFGLITSEDDGKTWTWSCEQEVANLATLYQLGPPPLSRLYALSEHGLVRSDDLSCTWSVAGGTAAHARLTDFFPDPTDPMRILVLGVPDSTVIIPAEVYESLDGGQTMGAALYQGPLRGDLTGIEIARADPRTLYLASYDTPGPRPMIIKSTDGGAVWGAPVDIESSLGSNIFRIIGVDPVDQQKIYLLVMEPLGQSLAISSNGGATFTTPVHFAVALTAFARLASGTILVAGLDPDAQGNPVGAGFRSSDGGQTFTPWPVPQLRALAERDGKLYGAADNFIDGFALGVSTDEGKTFRPMMKFSDVSSIRPCVRDACTDACRMLATANLWSDSVCAGVAPSNGGAGCAASGKIAARPSWLNVAALLLSVAVARRRRSLFFQQ